MSKEYYANGKAWGEAIRLSTNKISLDISDVFKNVAKRVFTEVINRTPVGVGPEVKDIGDTKANWNCSVGQPKAGYNDDRIDPSGKATIKRMTNAIDKERKVEAKAFYLTNNANWIYKLEYGEANTDKGYKSPVSLGSYNVSSGSYEIRSESGESKYYMKFGYNNPTGMVRGAMAMFEQIVAEEKEKLI